MCRKTCRSCVQKQAAFCEQRVQSRPEIFFRGGNYDRNTEKTAFADYDIRSFRDLFYRISPCMVYLPALCDGAGRLESGTGIHVLLSGTEHLCIRKYRRRKDAELL